MVAIKPDLDAVRQLSRESTPNGRYTVVPVSTELLSDSRTPIQVLRILKNVSRHCYILESVAGHEKWGRYTFLGFDPKLEITCRDGVVHVGDQTFRNADPDVHIRKVLASCRSPRFPYLPPFTGGLVGYFSYDYIRYAEPTLRTDAEGSGENGAGDGETDGARADAERFNDVDLMLFDKVIAFDNFRQKIILIVNISLHDPDREYARACRELEQMAELIRTGAPKAEPSGQLQSDFRQLFDRPHYYKMVEKAKFHIREGDIFQIVLSNRLDADYEGSLLNTYRVLRTVNPSPYMFYFASSDLEVAGASPETLVKLDDGVLHTFPLAGTRPRGATEEEDRHLEAELLADPKELAEHNMLVDLGRNDLGRVSRFGSVEVEKLRVIERYSHVMHIGSTVRGVLAPGLDALDALKAVLPAGTLSGAPKIMACRLIHELEQCRRGIYGGAIGYLDFTGNMDTCIAIRLAYRKNGRVFVRSGAGIVADSVPENEYSECINKAAAVVNALRMAAEVEE